MKRLGWLIAAILLVVVCTGSKNSVRKMPLSTSKSSVRNPIGDSAEYKLALSRIPDNRTASMKVTCSIEPASRKLSGLPPSITRTFVHRMYDKRGIFDVVYLLGSDDKGNLYFLGMRDKENTWYIVKNRIKPIMRPAKLTVGSQWAYKVELTNGYSVNFRDKVVGIEWLETPAGKLQTYRTQYVQDIKGENDVLHETGSEWVSPLTVLSLRLDSTLMHGDTGEHLVLGLESFKLAK